jgi:glycosyltransferase involved in cell wall biosynthesis
MSGPVSISAVLPAFNEQANLERAIDGLARALAAAAGDYEIIVVDDGSRDDSAAVLERLERRTPRLVVVRHERNLGYGAALRSGFRRARFSLVFFMDADNQFDPSEISRLLDRLGEADMVIGYRAVRRDPLPRRLNAWAFFTLVRVLFGYLARDVNCAFKLIRRELLEHLGLRSDGALINTELLVLARRRGARIVEVPVHHFPRTAGTQTGARPAVVLRAFRELFALRRNLGGRS